MTVGQLIKHLEALPADAPVVEWSNDFGDDCFIEIEGLCVVSLKRTQNGKRFLDGYTNHDVMGVRFLRGA